MLPIPGCKSRCSRRWERRRRPSRTRRCWWAPRAICRSGSVRSASRAARGRGRAEALLSRAGADRHLPAGRARSAPRDWRDSTSRIFGRAPAHFDPGEVEQLNARLLHPLDYAAVAERLPAGSDRKRIGCCFGRNLERLADFGGLVGCPSRRPLSRRTSATTSGSLCATRPAHAGDRLSGRAVEALTERVKSCDRQEGARAVSPVARLR